MTDTLETVPVLTKILTFADKGFYVYEGFPFIGGRPFFIASHFKLPTNTVTIPFCVPTSADFFEQELKTRRGDPVFKRIKKYIDKKTGILDGCDLYFFDSEKLITNQVKNFSIQNFVDGGYDIDNRILASRFSDFVLVDPKYPEFQKYAPNGIEITGTKAGKSESAQRTSYRTQEASVSGLLGFSTADSVNAGVMHNNNEPISIDEISPKDEDLYSKLNNIMENGRISIPKGKFPIVCVTTSPIRIMANPKIIVDSDYLDPENLVVQSIEGILDAISENASAFGSRLAYLIIDTDMKQAEKRENVMFTDFDIFGFEIIRQWLTGIFTKLLFNEHIIGWLEQKHPEFFVEKVIEIGKRIPTPRLRAMVLGIQYGYRHTRGFALRLALLRIVDFDKLGDMEYAPDIGALMKQAESVYHKECLAPYLKTLQQFTTQKMEEIMFTCLKDSFKNEPDYIRYFIELCWKLHEEVTPSFERVEAVYERDKTGLSFYSFRKRLRRRYADLTDYGVSIIGGGLLLDKKILELLCSGTNGTEGTTGANESSGTFGTGGTIGTSGTNGTG